MKSATKISTLHKYLCDLNPYTSPDSLLLSALIKISHVGTINRLQVQSSLISNPDHTTPANMYGINFLDSGSGKDKPLRDIDKNILEEIFDDFYSRSLRYREERNRNVVKEATEKYGEKSTQEKTKFINQNSARFLHLELSDATLEGFEATRQEYQRANFGGTFVKISEFGDYITTDNLRRMEFLSMVSEIYDHGDSNPKAIKGELISLPIKGIPSSAILHTSVSGLLEGRNRDKLFSFLNRGLARRSFICYPKDNVSINKISIDDLIAKEQEGEKKAKEIENIIKSDFNNFYQKTRKPDNVTYYGDNVYVFTRESEDLIRRYNIENKIQVSNIREDSDRDGIKSDIASRNWKALKLAGVIAAYEHPDKKTVEVEDVQCAIEITNIYSGHLLRFYLAKPTEDYERLFNYFIENKGVWLTKTDIKKQRIIGINKFSTWFNEAISSAEDLLIQQGYILQQEKVGKSGMKYRVMPVTRDPEDEPEEKKITISVGDTNKPTETHFKSASIKFSSLYKLTNLDRSWCATTFKDDYRKDDNATGNIDLVVFDVDSGMDMKDCIENLKSRKIKSLVTTTRSHQKKKDDKPACDRYRVILPLQKTETLSTEDYKMKITQAALSLGIPNDRATKNISRLWFGNPNQEYTYVDGGCIDLSVFKKPIYEPKADLGGKYNGSDNSGIKRWFADNWQKYGGRNNTLYIVKQFFMNDKQMDIESVKQAVLEVNDLMGDSIPVKEIEQTVFKSLKTLSVPLPDKKVPLPEEEAEVTVDDLPF